jgi:hypothetical protein
MSSDLDIKNYNYNDLLNLFSIKNTFDRNNVDIMVEKVEKIKKLAPNYYFFFNKAYKILLCIYELNNSNKIDITNLEYINTLVDKIINIDSFEHYPTLEIVNKLNIDYLKRSREMIDIEQNKTQEQIKSNYIQNTFVNSVAPGSLNSIKRITQFLNLNLNSCFRSNYYNSNPCDFQYNLPTEIKNVVSMRLASIEIPNAWYLFSSAKKNNSFVIEISKNGVISTYDITVPDGNYDNSMLENYLNTTYFYHSAVISDLNFIKFSIDPFNFKSKFELTGLLPDNFCFTLIFYSNATENFMNTFGWITGFRLAKYKNINSFIISEGLFDAGGDRYIYFSLEDYQYNNNVSNIVCFDQSIMEKNIIAKIPMINGKLSMIIDDNSCPLTKTRKYNGPVNIRNLHIKILDNFGNVIDLNNMDFSFTLELEILYEGFNFNDINS